MIKKIGISGKHKTLVLILLLVFSLVAGFSDYFHNHAPGEHAPDCPVFLLHHFFTTEAAVLTILVLFYSILFITAPKINLLLPIAALLHFLNRAPPVSFR